MEGKERDEGVEGGKEGGVGRARIFCEAGNGNR